MNDDTKDFSWRGTDSVVVRQQDACRLQQPRSWPVGIGLRDRSGLQKQNRKNVGGPSEVLFL
ncbi:hypothetical protein ACVWZV_003423 [Bradyrhizobium sp. GM5.1]